MLRICKILLKVLNIKTEIILKISGEDPQDIYESIHIGDHSILIAVKSALKDFYILQELFKYIIPVGYQYTFYFYKKLQEVT